MARRTTDVTIQAEGRDKGRVYLITEMPASQAEKWGARAVFALQKAGIMLPEVTPGMGMAGLAVNGVAPLVSLSFEDAEPLMDEMFVCIKIKPDPTKPDYSRPLVEEDIEEVFTRLRLRQEVLDLHLGFSIAAFLRRKAQEAADLRALSSSSAQT